MVVGLVVFLALLVVKFDTLSEPPAWDAAMAVHPAALTLAESGFDYPALLASPGYADGGPNSHSISLYTAFAAFIYWLFAPATALVILHLSTFALGALTAVGLVRFARHFLNPGQAVWAAAAAMSMPLVLTQFGMVYLEAPVLAATTWALVAAIERRWIATAGFSLLATAVKPSGAITAAALTLFALYVQDEKRRAFAILLPSGTVLLLATLANPTFAEASFGRAAFIVQQSWRYLISVPDLLAVLTVAVLAAWRLLGAGAGTHQGRRELGTLWLMFAVPFLVFYGLLASSAFTTLPRYYIQIAPLAVIMILVALLDDFGNRAFRTAAIGLLLFFSLNFNGWAYPRQDTNNFALIERSDAYEELLGLELEATKAICRLANEAPVWYPLPEGYRLRYATMGYAVCPDPGRVFNEESDIALGDLPSDLFVAYEHPWLGGATLARLVAEAEASSDWYVTVVETIEVGRFRQEIYRLTRSP